MEVDQIQGVDLKLAAEAEGEPARLLGMLVNTGTRPLEVTVSDADDSATLTVGADDTFSFTDNPTIVGTAGADVGDKALMVFSVPVAASEESVEVPVYQGPIGGYSVSVSGVSDP